MVKRHEDTIGQTQENLSRTQRQLFLGTCFGKFIDMKDNRFSIVLVHLVFFRRINHREPFLEFWFQLNKMTVRFSSLKFALVIGLRFSH